MCNCCYSKSTKTKTFCVIFLMFPHRWQSWRSWTCSFQKHRCRRTQRAQWSWPMTTGCPRTDQSQGPPSQHEPVCGRQRKKHSRMKRQFVGKRDATGGQGSVLRGAAVEFSVFECEDVNGAFVTGGTEERGVMAEVDAGKINKTREKPVRAWSKQADTNTCL